MSNRQSPLHAQHVSAGAKLVDFGGWDMPLCYDTGTVAEHLACRNDAAMFDVSHLGTVRVSGAAAHETLQWAFTNDLNRIGAGAAQYTHMLDPDDASVLDDIIVWQIAEDVFDVMPNASNTDRVTQALHAASGDGSGGDRAGGSLHVADVTAGRAVIAVQGPQARTRLARVSPEAAAVGRFKVISAEVCGATATVAGTGYTGEDGVEMAVPVSNGAKVWAALLEAGVVAAGLGARDTLRLEAGLPLHGHELGPGITPLQAGLGWVARFDKGDFRGRAALLAEKEAGPHRVLRALLGHTRRPLRDGCPVLADGEVAGEVTSGNYSPILGRGIALALVSPQVVPEDEVAVDVRGREMPATVVKGPFHKLNI